MVKEKVDYLSYLLRLWREGEEKTAQSKIVAVGNIACPTTGRSRSATSNLTIFS